MRVDLDCMSATADLIRVSEMESHGTGIKELNDCLQAIGFKERQDFILKTGSSKASSTRTSVYF